MCAAISRTANSIRKTGTSRRVQLIEELEGARAAVERLRQRERDLDADSVSVDDETEALELLAHFRAAVGGEVKDAKTVEEARTALRRVFSHFVLHVQGEPGAFGKLLESQSASGSSSRSRVRAQSCVPGSSRRMGKPCSSRSFVASL